MVYKLTRGLLRLIVKIKGCRVDGLENVPQEGPLIIAANHTSYWDPILVACFLDRQIFFMGKDNLFRYPVFGWFLRQLGAFPVNRGQGDIKAIRRSIAILKEGNMLGIFPEGTRSKTKEISKALAGIGLIVDKSKAPVLPIFITGSKGYLRQARGTAHLIIGQPLLAENMTIPEEASDRRTYITQYVMDAVAVLKEGKV